MSTISIALSAVMTLALTLMIAPGVFRMNQGKILRNIALWLAIFAGLGLVYQYVGPGASRAPMQSAPALDASQPESGDAAKPGAIDVPDGNRGYTPPGE